MGASGAISAVLGGYLVLLPQAKVLTLIVFVLREMPGGPLPPDLVRFPAPRGSAAIAHPEAGGGVAFFAHIGGFVFGVAHRQAPPETTPLAPSH